MKTYLRCPSCETGFNPEANSSISGPQCEELASPETEAMRQVAKWLGDEGYPFEMKVARAFRLAGFEVEQSGYYRDRETQCLRETDVIARLRRKIGEHVAIVEFIVECKSSTDKPWVVFSETGTRFAEPFTVAQRAASEIGDLVLRSVADFPEIHALDLFRISDTIAYSVRRMREKAKNSSDIAYNAVRSVIDATNGELAYANRYLPSHAVCLIAFPVVAVEGLMFKCALNRDCKLSVREISSATLVQGTPIGNLPRTIVKLITDKNVDAFATTCAASAAQFLSVSEGIIAKHCFETKERAKRMGGITTRLSS
jgi:hypothetical protein